MVKKLGTLVNKESELIHSPFHGERIMGREAIGAKIKMDNTSWQDVQIHSYSPFGVEFLNNGFNFRQGQAVDLRIKLAGDETEFSGLVVDSLHEDNGTKLVGIRTFKKDTSDQGYSGAERRAHRRWNCSEDFLPTGTAPNPVKYNDYVLFRVEDISHGGLRIITSMRNKFLGMGQHLECTLSLPYVGTVRTDLQIKHINTTLYKGKEFMVLGTKFIKRDHILERSLGEYLLNFAKNISLKNLKEEGFNIKKVSKWLDFSYVKTEEEYKEVLDLRLRAYQSVGKIKLEAKQENMSDEYDAKSEIMIVKHNNKIVGSQRLMFPFSEEETEYYDKSLLKGNYNFPKVTDIAEWSRLCIEDVSRGADIFYQLASQAILAAVKNNRKYVRLNSSNAVSHYRSCGFVPTGVKYTNKIINNQQTEIMILDIHGAAVGRGIGIKHWNKLFKDLIDYMLEKRLIEYSYIDIIRINLYKSLGRIWN